MLTHLVEECVDFRLCHGSYQESEGHLIKFLLCESVSSAGPFAEERGWLQVGHGRYFTPEGDEIRVAARPTDLCPVRGDLQFLAGPGFEAGQHVLAFRQMLKDGLARWIKK